MKRALAVVLAVAAGLVAGGLAAGYAEREPDTVAPVPSTSTSSVVRVTSRPAEPPPADGVLLAWTQQRGLPAGFADRIAAADGVSIVSVVRSGKVGLAVSRDAGGVVADQTPPGFIVPLDVLAFDPATYPDLFDDPALAPLRALAPNEVLLGATSAKVRRIGKGGILELAGGPALTVAGVVDDELVGAAEVAMTTAGAQAVGVTAERAVLIEYDAGRAELERAVRAAAPGLPLRFRGPGETTYLRPGDAVLPQARVKELFGEFAYRPGAGREFTQDPAWTAEHLAIADVPLLGQVRCHEAVLSALEGALRELVQRNLASLVDPAGFQGCWNPRLIRPGAGVSRHSWGIALDINWTGNRTGLGSSQDPRLVEVMERWGFGWGGRWLVPDPAHFEYLRPPR